MLTRQRTWRLLDGMSGSTVGLTNQVPWLVFVSNIPPPPLHNVIFSPQKTGQACRADVREKGLTSGRLTMGWGSSRFV